MYSPEAISKDTSNNLMNSSSNNNSSSFKHGFLDGGFLKSKEIMGLGSISSDLSQQQQQGNNSSLMRYRSAPSSYFASYLDANNNNNNSGDSSESESIFASFTNCNEQRNHGGLGGSGSVKMELNEVQSNPEMMNQKNGNGFLYQAAVSAGGGTVVGSYSVPLGVDNQVQMRTNNNGNHSNLIRQSSSPAGFFSGFDVMREVGKFRSSNGETSSSTSGLNNHLNFSSGPSPTTRFMPSILEDATCETLGAAGNQENVRLGNADENSRGYAPGFSSESWNDSAFNSLKRNRDGDLKIFSDFNGLENQDGEPRNYAHSLNRHLSLPKTANEMAAVEKYIQFQQDSGVPCKMRAKRGFATHPRSIAERMRRIRISDRMKKLQELFPNMDKQTNTADMLDLAVEYIKDLQNHVQTLTETKAKCKCSK